MAENYSIIGFSFQKMICNKYSIVPTSNKLQNLFESLELLEDESLISIINKIFNEINLKPEYCTTLTVDESNSAVPHNFILENNSTLSIRTNKKGTKVAPRIIGQAGYSVLNLYFKNIYGKEIKTQNDIKNLIINKIDKCLPIFFEKLMDADYIVWIYKNQDNSFSYEIIDGDSLLNIEFDKNLLSFTKGIDEWNESTTLKYNGLSIAEIQVHTNRTFKFRFILKNIVKLLKDKETTNETFGISAEKAICDLFNLDYPNSFKTRSSKNIVRKLKPVILDVFKELPKPIKHSGSEVGTRGGASKSSFDFILEGNKKLSLKTNFGKMVCPPEVGQPNDKTCYLYFKDYIDGDKVTKENFKIMVYEHIEDILPIYMNHLFDSDYLLRISLIKKGKKESYKAEVYEQFYGNFFKWEKLNFSFSKKQISDWKVSNTVYYNDNKIGEFEVHNSRNCYKFRFEFDSLIKLIEQYKNDLGI